MRRVLFLVLGLALMLPVAASAQLTAVDGAPYAANSWSQNFLTPGNNFDQLRFDWISGSQFSSPFIATSEVGWSQLAGVATLAAIGGVPTGGAIGYTLTFQDPMSAPTSFYGTRYNGTTKVATERFDWSGSGWNIYFVDGVDPGAVPEPGTFALLGLGLLGIGVVRRRKQVA